MDKTACAVAVMMLAAVCGGGAPLFAGDRPDSARGRLPDGPSPVEVAAKLANLFLSTEPDLYRPAGYRAPKAYGGRQLIHYSVVSLWVNALECAHAAGDVDLERRLIAAFEPAYGEKKIWMNEYRHVDLSIVGAIPLEIAILTGDERAKKLGLRYADRQWEAPREGQDWGERWYAPIPLAERQAWWEKGYSPETRLWLDDMYMITLLQSQAYRLTGERKYIERAAKEMCLYLERLPRPDGLFNHAPQAPFVWGRGNGWLAAAMAMNLKYLPADSEWRAPILAGYRRMMAALLRWQRPNGLWGQLVDDPESYDETSATAMFAYAFAEGVNAGVLGDDYRAAAGRAYRALVARLDDYGNLPDVCVGTGWKNDRHHYLTRPKANGDPHGQAPLLWLCAALAAAGRPLPPEPAAGAAAEPSLSSAQDITRFESGGALARDPSEKPVDAPRDMKLVLCMGQSNMAGRAKMTDADRAVVPRAYKLDRDGRWVAAKAPYHFDKAVAAVGPVDEFVRRYLADHPGESVGVVPCAVGGSPFSSWDPPPKGPRKGANYAAALARAKIAQANGRFVAILWHQGETDAAKAKDETALNDAYPKDVARMMTALRAELGEGDVPVIAGEIGRWMRPDGDHAARINPGIGKIPSLLSNAAVVSSEGLANQDRHHFDREGQRILGGRYYEAFQSLERRAAAQ